MNLHCLLSGILALILAFGCNKNQRMFEEPLSPRNANYSIECKFDPETKLITGKEYISWTNISNKPAQEIQLHLYMNAFGNENSTFLTENREIPLELRGNWGYCRIRNIHLKDGTDLNQSISFIQPDDGNRGDSTVVSVTLPTELQANETIEIRIAFETKLPPIVERAGFRKSFHMMTQWYPKIGVYSDSGWNCHQYHANSEFFADFGIYDITIALPAQYMVGATGVLINTEPLENNRKRIRYYAEDVHDFAWAVDTNFTEVNDQIAYTKIRLLAQSEHSGDVAERIIESVKSAYPYFTERYGAYPYPQITIIDAPVFNVVMEYPMLFLTGNFDGYSNPPAPNQAQPQDNLFLERLTIHEFGHQWFYGICASNEFEEAWLDEGMTEYITAKAFENGYGKIMQNDESGNLLPVRDFRKQLYLSNPMNPAILNYSWHYTTYTEYYVASYVKPKLLLYTLDNYLGEEVMEKVVHTFFKRWQYKHPSTHDFIEIFTEIAGENLQTFIHHYLGSSDYLDFKIVFADHNRVKIGRSGGLVFPVYIKFTLDNGENIVKKWTADESEITYEFDHGNRLAAVHIDPEEMIEFEVNKENNVWGP